jgi:hypothetical protein
MSLVLMSEMPLRVFALGDLDVGRDWKEGQLLLVSFLGCLADDAFEK